MTTVAMETKHEVLTRAAKRIREQVAMHGITDMTFQVLRIYERRYALAGGPEANLDQITLDCLSKNPRIENLCRRPEHHTGDHTDTWGGTW